MLFGACVVSFTRMQSTANPQNGTQTREEWAQKRTQEIKGNLFGIVLVIFGQTNVLLKAAGYREL